MGLITNEIMQCHIKCSKQHGVNQCLGCVYAVIMRKTHMNNDYRRLSAFIGVYRRLSAIIKNYRRL